MELAKDAQALAGQPATGVRAWAFALEARGQARLGCRQEALIAVRSAEAVYEHLSSGAAYTGGFGFHPHLMHFCQENALMFAGENKEAIAHQDEASNLKSAVPSHRVLVALDRASCLLRAGDLDEGCRTASQSLAGLQADPWPGIILFRAREVAAATSRNKHLEPVRALRELLRIAEGPQPHLAASTCVSRSPVGCQYFVTVVDLRRLEPANVLMSHPHSDASEDFRPRRGHRRTIAGT